MSLSLPRLSATLAGWGVVMCFATVSVSVSVSVPVAASPAIPPAGDSSRTTGAATGAPTASSPAPSSASAPGGLSEDRYVYHRVGSGRPMSTSLVYEAGYGTRETRFFGDRGAEQRVRLRFQPWSFLQIEAWGGLLVSPDGDTLRGAGAVEVRGRVLRQDRHAVSLHLGGGYLYDYRGDHVLRFRAALSRRFGRVDTILSTLLEVPLTGARDEVDVMVSAAAMVRITRWYSQGLEVGGEDLEGLSDPEEAEGGARFIFGPTALFRPWRGLTVRANVSAVYAHTANQAGSEGPTWGALARLLVGYTF